MVWVAMKLWRQVSVALQTEQEILPNACHCGPGIARISFLASPRGVEATHKPNKNKTRLEVESSRGARHNQT
jgi:hypothetical protein